MKYGRMPKRFKNNTSTRKNGEKMSQKIIINVPGKEEHLKNPMEMGLDDDWKIKRRKMDSRINAKGVYVIYVTNPLRIIHVGETRGATKDFGTRLYRHATKSASTNSNVYEALKKVERETGGPILVSLLSTEQIRSFFEGKELEDEVIIDIYEQVEIHLLKPEV